VTTAVPTCPRCATSVGGGQEYCLTCGSRLPGPGRLRLPPTATRPASRRLVLLALVALGGMTIAIAVTRDATAPEPIVTAIGGSATVAVPAVDPVSRLATWPRGRTAWTIALASVPKVDGRGRAVAVAQQARTEGLRRVGVLDSSRFGSLRPGYWVVFTGLYESQPEATGLLRQARRVVRSARTQEVVP
jgi:hypothetical protein